MANHSLGGLRSLETIHAPDRTITRLSPIQTWILKQALERPGEYVSLPPQSNIRAAAKRLYERGLVWIDRNVTEVKYKPMASSPAPGVFLPNEITDKFMGSATLKRGRPCE